jgi:hypothetical protein
MMSRRDEWKMVLDAETERWSGMCCEQLMSELHEGRCYQIEVRSKQYQVEVEILENTGEYLHVALTVDDGSLPMSIVPVTRSFIRQKASQTRIEI